jgi:hypothetical protein
MELIRLPIPLLQVAGQVHDGGHWTIVVVVVVVVVVVIIVEEPLSRLSSLLLDPKENK